MEKLNQYKALKEEISKEYGKAWAKSPDMVEYCTKKVNFACKLSNGGIFTIEKPSIETRFCFGESGYDMKDACDMVSVAYSSEEYFKRENLQEFDDVIAVLEGKNVDTRHPYASQQSYYGCGPINVYELETKRPWQIDEREETDYEIKELVGDDLDAVTALYKEARDDFEKRLNIYLKKYGLSKVRAWTYWRDE